MPVLKYGGRDFELSTTGVDRRGRPVDSFTVTCEVLARLRPALEQFGAKVWSRSTRPLGAYGYLYRDGSAHTADCLRTWSSAGQCFYADMSHCECCTAATTDPLTFAAQGISTLLAVERARQLAEQEADGDVHYALTTASVDLLDPGISFGPHVSLQVSRGLWEDLLLDHRHPAILGFVTSALAAAVPFFGAGYILPLRDAGAIYSLSSRAHHLTKVQTLTTTEAFGRGLLNSRRERHGHEHERLHLICFDFCLLSAALMFSFVQCVLAAAEEGFCGLNVFDPLDALHTWSWQMDLATGRLPATVLLVDGRRLSLPGYIRVLCRRLLQMCEQRLIPADVAPRATELLPRIIDLAAYAEEGSLVRCSRHLGWASKILWLTQLCNQHGVSLDDARLRLADHDFGHTDPARGAVWQLWERGLVDPLVDRAAAVSCLTSGPIESRDWGRGRILEKFHAYVADVDWSFIDLRTDASRWSPRLRIEFPSLDSLNKACFETLIDAANDPVQLSRRLAAQRDAPEPQLERSRP
ncbi:MAG: proteasome accessory factor PafA2 family protein [Pirellulaceae bacterium]|jgi:hypothetical protein|nr:proteasome accessory factor PafA2 family protein [Pirellulaceae bacterium]